MAEPGIIAKRAGMDTGRFTPPYGALAGGASSPAAHGKHIHINSVRHWYLVIASRNKNHEMGQNSDVATD